MEAAVELGWERYIGLEGRFIGMHSFGASGKIADVYKKFDINTEAVVRAAHETLAEVAAPSDEVRRVILLDTPDRNSETANGGRDYYAPAVRFQVCPRKLVVREELPSH